MAPSNPIEEVLEPGLPGLQHVRVKIVRELLLRKDKSVKARTVVGD